jgi:hypothetical protein
MELTWLRELSRQLWHSPPRRRRRTGPRPFRPRLEALERRLAPATFLVTDSADAGAGSLRQAILDLNQSADATNMVSFEAAGNPINLETALPTIQKSVEIMGPGQESLTIQRAANTPFRIFTIDVEGTVAISDLTIANGQAPQAPGQSAAGGGVLVSRGTLTLDGVAFSQDKAIGANGAAGGDGMDGLGGAVCDAAGTPLTVSDSTFTGNTAAGGAGAAGAAGAAGGTGGVGAGGAIYESAGGQISNCTFLSNEAKGGNGGPGDITRQGSFAKGSGGAGQGGAVDQCGPSAVSISGCSFSLNHAVGGDGGACRTSRQPRRHG